MPPEHDPEKACPRTDPRVETGFRKGSCLVAAALFLDQRVKGLTEPVERHWNHDFVSAGVRERKLSRRRGRAQLLHRLFIEIELRETSVRNAACERGR